MWTDIISYINARIYPNNNNEITAEQHREAIGSLANRTHAAFFQGVATELNSPALDGDAPRWWIASRGNYPNYGNLTVSKDVGILLYRNGWTLHELDLFTPRVFEITGVTSTSFTINNAVVRDQNDYTDAEMDMNYIEVKRGSTILRYNRNSPNRLEYFAVQNGSNVVITLGRLPLIDDVFRIALK